MISHKHVYHDFISNEKQILKSGWKFIYRAFENMSVFDISKRQSILTCSLPFLCQCVYIVYTYIVYIVYIVYTYIVYIVYIDKEKEGASEDIF